MAYVVVFAVANPAIAVEAISDLAIVVSIDTELQGAVLGVRSEPQGGFFFFFSLMLGQELMFFSPGVPAEWNAENVLTWRLATLPLGVKTVLQARVETEQGNGREGEEIPLASQVGFAHTG